MNKQETEALRAEIMRTRADLGVTIQQLAERMDVKSRMQHSVRRAGSNPLPWFVLAAGAAVATVMLVLASRGRR
ncbi:MAG TPA: DUF3618 domain-containing protein [Natronosporangium sp.]